MIHPKLHLQASITILYSLLQDCIKKKDVSAGRRVYSLILNNGFQTNTILAYHLIIMFASCGELQEAQQVFRRLPQPSAHAWAAIISSHLQHGRAEQALQLYFQMAAAKPNPNPSPRVYVAVIKACASMNDLIRGRLIHRHVMENGVELSVFVASSLIHMYAKCGSLDEARRVFDSLPSPNVVAWTAMITGYAQQSCGNDALELFDRMQQEGIRPNIITFVTSLKACANLGALEKGKKIHSQTIDCGLESLVVVANSLIDMYISCGRLDKAHKVFDKLPERDVISWTAILSGYAQHGLFLDALHRFEQMQQEGFEPNKVTFLSIFKACSGLAALDLGKLIHKDMVRSGLEMDVVIGSTLIDMYAKCGSICEAIKVFNELPDRNVVSWTAIISGYTHLGLGKQALELFDRMQQEAIPPNSVTYLSALKACASVAALSPGRKIHSQIKENGLVSHVPIGNALIDMYASCADLNEARKVFDGMPQRDVVSWTAMISGYAQQGLACEAFRLFDLMQQDGLKPNKVTFVSMLTACSHVGLMSKAVELFTSMSDVHDITPQMEHYVCMVDLLGRAGHLYEAEEFISNMPLKPDAVIWMSVLGACRTHGKVDLGRRSFESIVKLEPTNKAAYALMSNIYAASHRWDDKADIVKRLKIVVQQST